MTSLFVSYRCVIPVSYLCHTHKILYVFIAFLQLFTFVFSQNKKWLKPTV